MTFDREIKSAWLFDQLFTNTREYYARPHFFDDVTIQNGVLKPKKVLLIHLARHSVSAFDFNEKWRSATWKSLFENKIEKSSI